MKFNKKYFDEIYTEDSLIDGDFNAKDHAKYLHYLMKVVEVPVNSVIDFGFGKAKLLYEVQKTFKASRVAGLDVSEYAYQNLKKKSWVEDVGVELFNMSITDFTPPEESYDLALCNSVLQYVPDDELERAVQCLAYSAKYIYLHIPTQEDYKKLKDMIQFEDPYAIQRPTKLYDELFDNYFKFVGWGLLESRYQVEEEFSLFFDTLFRFPRN